MIGRIAALSVAAMLLAGCKDDRPPRWVHACVESHTQTVTSYYFVNGSMRMAFTPITVCERREWECHVGKDYKGSHKCMGLPG